MEDTPTQEIPRDTFGEATAVESEIRENVDRDVELVHAELDVHEPVNVPENVNITSVNQTGGVTAATVTSTTDSPPETEVTNCDQIATSNVVEATEACRQAEPELAGMPPQQDEAKLAFTPDQLDAAGVVYQESEGTKFIEINAKAQGHLIALAPVGTTPNEILQAVIVAYGIEGDASINTNPVSQTLLIWQTKQGKGPAAQEAASVPASNSSASGLTIDQLLTLHQQTCDAARSIMRAKSSDYTNGSVDPFANFRSSEVLGVPAEKGILIRSLDKFKRIETFIDKGTLQVQGESVEDAIQDVVNYMILLKGLIVERGIRAGRAA